jgi:2-polyprenyl-3-methyl-5-hydroxy-6-metoxy-1,4-benzoquinol methylase
VEAELVDTTLEPVMLAASGVAPLQALYRTSVLAFVGHPPAMALAVFIARWSKVPWCAVLDTQTIDAVRRQPNSIAARASRQAAAVLLDEVTRTEAKLLFKSQRIVLFGERDRLRRIAFDTAVAPEARGRSRGWTATLANAWTFSNDRATRLAIRLMPIVKKTPAPIHPRHLIGGSWHFWYLDHLSDTDRVLDVGCANGAHSFAAARFAASVVGVDLDATELARATSRASVEKVENVNFTRADLSEPAQLMEIADAPFDAILLLDVLEHLCERTSLLRHLRDLLQPQGKLFVSVPNRETPYRKLLRRLGGFAFSDPDHKVEYTEVTIEAELREAGFAIRSIDRGGYDTPFVGFSTLVALVSLRMYRRLAERRARLSQRFPERATALRVIATPENAASGLSDQ